MNHIKDLLFQFENQFQRQKICSRPDTLNTAAWHMLGRPGKRVRPILCLLANELFSELKDDTFIVANALEILHNSSLIHDDIMDEALIRRGDRTVHAAFGVPTAILVGDMLLSKSYKLMCSTNMPAARLLKVFNNAVANVCRGQQMDIDFQSQSISDVSYSDYTEMIMLKTSMLLAASLQLGSIIGGANENDQRKLRLLGLCIGIGFQIQDDYLDAFGDPTVTGKPIGGDIMLNKKTFLSQKTWEISNTAQRKKMLDLMKIDDERKIEYALQLYHECKIEEWFLKTCRGITKKCVDILCELKTSSEVKNDIIYLVQTILGPIEISSDLNKPGHFKPQTRNFDQNLNPT